MSKSYNLNVFYANRDLAKEMISSLRTAEMSVRDDAVNDLLQGFYYVDSKIAVIRDISALIDKMEISIEQIDKEGESSEQAD